MPHAALTNGELMKKTLRTTLVMVGTTAVWLGALTGVVVMTTGPSASATAESKVDKAAGSVTVVPGMPGAPGTRPAPGGLDRLKAGRHPGVASKGEGVRPGDPI